MDTNSMFGFIDIIVVGCGAYGIYSWYMLVKKLEIKRTFLLGNSTMPEDCKDIQGFADFIGTKLLIFSIVMMLFGGISAINDYVQSVGDVIWFFMALFMAMLVWYCVQLRKADQLFFKKGPKAGNTIKNKALNKK